MPTYGLVEYCDKCGEPSATYKFKSTAPSININLTSIEHHVRYSQGQCLMCRVKFRKFYDRAMDGPKWYK